MEDFVGMNKIPRLSRDVIVSEKIDGTNAQVFITEDERILVGSKNRYIIPDNDNHGFAKWVKDNREELLKLGPGRHFGEWWGLGVQRGYGLKEKRFSLFNVNRWEDDSIRPYCCSVVPVLYRGPFSTTNIDAVLQLLSETGSKAAPGYMNPEGIVIFHTQGNLLFKKTIGDDGHKGDKNG